MLWVEEAKRQIAWRLRAAAASGDGVGVKGRAGELRLRGESAWELHFWLVGTGEPLKGFQRGSGKICLTSGALPAPEGSWWAAILCLCACQPSRPSAPPGQSPTFGTQPPTAGSAVSRRSTHHDVLKAIWCWGRTLAQAIISAHRCHPTPLQKF